jgi:lantibiotic modifying enzyme
MHGFPASLTSFVGRAQATAEIAAQLTECRLVTVTGPGGAGKTRLAGEVARRVAMSALGADSEQHPGIAIPAWRNINTDQMMRTTSAAEGPGMDHRVRLGDAWPTALDYLDALLDGFVAGYRCFLQGREELSADSEVKAALSGGGLRVLLRDTANYARLLLYLLQPKFLRDGLDRSIEIEWLARTLTAVNPSPAARLSIYDIERRAMEVQDIPHFTVSVWRAITGACPDQDLRALGNGRGPETLYHRLGTLSETDLQKNMAIIAEAVRQRFAPDVNASED